MKNKNSKHFFENQLKTLQPESQSLARAKPI